MTLEASLAEKAATLRAKAPKSRKVIWNRPVPSSFSEGTVLSFDQTFSKTGWCLVRVEDRSIDVLAKGFIQEPPIPDTAKFEDILQRSEWMYDRIGHVIRSEVIDRALDGDGFTVIHEAPILHGMRIEASLLGGFAVRIATRRALGTIPVIVENRRMLAVLVPPEERLNQAGKSHITRALLPYWDTRKGWNEHNRDALALGLTYLHDKEG